jgi:hypothetical protein
MPDTCFVTHKKQVGVLRFGKSTPFFLNIFCDWETLMSLNEYLGVDEKETCAMIICSYRKCWAGYEDLLKKNISELKCRISFMCNIDEEDFYS